MGLRTKINVKFGAEVIMDLSNYGKINTFRKELIAKSPAMIGTVPMYDAVRPSHLFHVWQDVCGADDEYDSGR